MVQTGDWSAAQCLHTGGAWVGTIVKSRLQRGTCYKQLMIKEQGKLYYNSRSCHRNQGHVIAHLIRESQNGATAGVK